MGLDLALGVIVLVAAFRGWFQGFVSQAVRMSSLVIAIYTAAPVRDYAKPYVSPHLSSIDPSVIDRILWWVSAVAVNLVLVGVASLVIKMTRRPEIPGIVQSGRNDQFAGFFVGAMKGLLAAVFVAAGIQNYAMDQIKSVNWADEQVKASWALKWNEAYQPARKIWASRPVRHIVDHIERMGLRRPGDPSEAQSGDDTAGDEVVRTASRAAQGEGERAAGESASAAHPSASSSPPPAEAGSAGSDKTGEKPAQLEKFPVDNAN